MRPRANLFLDRVVPICLAGLSLCGVYREQTVLAVLAAALLLILWTARFWATHALDSVSYERMLSADRAFPGDTVDLTIRVVNRKLLPLTWIELTDVVPAGLLGVESAGRTTGTVWHTTALSWHQAVTWRHSLRCGRRGEYIIGPASLASGDPFGFFPSSSSFSDCTSLIVYPRLIQIDSLPVSPDLPGGGRRPERWIFEDASRTIGAREYLQGDSLRRLHWKATARRRSLQSRVYEPTTEMEIVVALAIGTFMADLDLDRDQFELGVSVAASLARRFCDLGYPVGLYANGGGVNGAGTLEVAPGNGPAQLIAILEALARVTSSVAVPAETYLTDVVPRLPWGASVVVVAGNTTPELDACIALLRSGGRRVSAAEVARIEKVDDRERVPATVL